MVDAPERIWAEAVGDCWWFAAVKGNSTVEYLRADIAARQLAEAQSLGTEKELRRERDEARVEVGRLKFEYNREIERAAGQFRRAQAAEAERDHLALERIAVWLESQRQDVPAHGWEFAAAIRAMGERK